MAEESKIKKEKQATEKRETQDKIKKTPTRRKEEISVLLSEIEAGKEQSKTSRKKDDQEKIKED